ncbi:MAG: leucine-rich repeat protein [Muribaculaceae bacterium]|nr:leucine-rich repeat protein [Muribaculaceae bacterium]
MKRFIFLIATMAMLAMNATANVTFNVGELRFWVCDDGKSVFLQKGGNISGDLYIPQIVNDGDKDYTVVGISISAFYKNTGLTSVYIPNTVKYIFRAAFYGCTSLNNVTVPNTLEFLGDDVFYNTPWFNAKPNGPVYIGKTLYVYKNPSSMPAGTNIVIQDGTTHIARYAFMNCSNLSSIHIPNSVTSIGDLAFVNCTSLTSLTIPNSAINLGPGVFKGCTHLTSVTLPSSIPSIPPHFFNNCNALTSVTIPSSIETIGDHAFYACNHLTSVVIPNKVKAIGNNAFAECTHLTDITVPSSVRFIDFDAFTNTAWLNNQPNGIVYAGPVAYTYKGTPSGIITINEGTTAIASKAFYECSGITVLRLPNSLNYIGDNAFQGCSSLTYLNFPSNLKAIGDYAFNRCTNLTEITFPNSLISVGCNTYASNVFYLTQWYEEQPDGILYAGPVAIGYKGTYPDDRTITVKEGTKAIGARGVGTGATKVILPNTITTLGKRAFQDCSKMTEVNIPQSVTDIGYLAFEGVTSLKHIYAYVDPANVKLGDDAIIMGMPELDDYYDKISYGLCFYFTNTSSNCMDDCVLHVLPGKEESFANAWSWARFKNIVGDLGASVTGDVNGDGTVTAADVTALYDYLLNNDETHIVNGDQTGDGIITAADITAVYNVLLGS